MPVTHLIPPPGRPARHGPVIVGPVNLIRSGTLFSLTTFACLAGLVLAGCGGTVIDPRKAEGAIAQNVEKETGARIKSVTCPSGVDVVTGATFECQILTEDGRTATAVLKIRNDQADVSIVKLTKS